MGEKDDVPGSSSKEPGTYSRGHKVRPNTQLRRISHMAGNPQSHIYPTQKCGINVG